jgi:hypothetical protein
MKYLVPALAIFGGFSLAVAGFKWAQSYMNDNGAGSTGSTGSIGRIRGRMGVPIIPSSVWEKNKYAQGILHTLG